VARVWLVTVGTDGVLMSVWDYIAIGVVAWVALDVLFVFVWIRVNR
jgi:hypothetical protein